MYWGKKKSLLHYVEFKGVLTVELSSWGEYGKDDVNALSRDMALALSLAKKQKD